MSLVNDDIFCVLITIYSQTNRALFESQCHREGLLRPLLRNEVLGELGQVSIVTRFEHNSKPHSPYPIYP